MLASTSSHSEGYLKVRKRMKKLITGSVEAGKSRVNRIMRENGLLSPFRFEKKVEKCKHDGTIVTEELNQMWATDGKKFWIEGQGWHWFFGVIEHYNDEILSWHIVKGKSICGIRTHKRGNTQAIWLY